MQLDLFEDFQVKRDLFAAYYDARKNKRNTINALQFELNLETNILQLYREIMDGTYQLSPCICFIVHKPVKREIFAANFRDRVVHHFIINKLLPIFENQFIYDSYSCRVGKGTLFGIRRLQKFILQCSHNYTSDAYILKLDIQGFFMNINKQLLYNKIETLIRKKYKHYDMLLVLQLVKIMIMNDPTQNCLIKGKKSDWNGLPANKSLFKTPSGCGLPIGNLTSQIFANYYLNDFDHFVKETLKIKYYGRYVDDFFVIHSDPHYLRTLIPLFRHYLNETVGARLHPNKIYLQSYAKGVSCLGAFIKPFHSCLSKRISHNFYEAVSTIKSAENSFFHRRTYKEEYKTLEATINSYLGICHHYKNYRFCQQNLSWLSIKWLQFFIVGSKLRKIRFVNT